VQELFCCCSTQSIVEPPHRGMSRRASFRKALGSAGTPVVSDSDVDTKSNFRCGCPVTMTKRCCLLGLNLCIKHAGL
jgi:hypothetical protein